MNRFAADVDAAVLILMTKRGGDEGRSLRNAATFDANRREDADGNGVAGGALALRRRRIKIERSERKKSLNGDVKFNVWTGK